MRDKKRFNAICISLIFCAIFAITLYGNYYTRLYLDDFAYLYKLESLSTIPGSLKDCVPNFIRCRNFADVFVSQINHYRFWGGRTVAHIIAQLFLLSDSGWIFDIANSIMLCVLVYLIAVNICRSYRTPAWSILLSFGLYWVFNPVLGETAFWLVGSCNYLWTMCIMLWVITQYRFDDVAKKSGMRKGLFLFLCLCGGWSNENVSFAVIVYILIILLLKKKNKASISSTEKIGFVLTLIGFVFMLAAPGNYLRSSFITSQDMVGTGQLVDRLRTCVRIIVYYYMKMFILSVLTYMLYWLMNKKMSFPAFKRVTLEWGLFLLAFLGTNFAMIASKTYPSRTSVGPMIFLIISFGSVLYDMVSNTKTTIAYIPTVIVTVLLVMSMSVDFICLKQQGEYAMTVEHDLNDRRGTNEDVVLEYERSMERDPHVIDYYGSVWWYYAENPDEYVNALAAPYYGLNSITVYRK